MDPIPLPILWDVREYLRQKRDQLTELKEVKKTQVKIQFSKNNGSLAYQNTLKAQYALVE